MAKFCGNCGSKMDSDASFCTNCGSSGNAEVKAAPVANESNGQTVNGMAKAGFILSFFVPALGLIFSIIGLNKAKQLSGNGKGLATAGLILSIIWLVIAIVASILYYVLIIAAVSTGSSSGSGYYY